MMKLPSSHYKWVPTEDGSQTLHSELFGEACHSTSGARAETHLHYIEGCQLKERLADFQKLEILEVGFGLGIGFLMTLETLENRSPWHFVSMEIDPDLVKWFLNENSHLSIIKNAKWVSDNLVKATFENIELTIVVGDARTQMPLFLGKEEFHFHAIFQDAFSPKRNPMLWTVEWFTLLKDHSHQDCILSTYSASSSIRKSLVHSGWKVTKGHKFGPKRSSTRATLKGESDEDILKHLSHSPVGPIRDQDAMEFSQNKKESL